MGSANSVGDPAGIHTSPSSLCTSRRSPSNSSSTNPRTNAFSVSRSHTYLFPEKSFSPSSPRIWSAPRRSSSDLIKLGANVPEEGLFFAELDRSRFPLGENVGDSCETDGLRRWPLADSSPWDGVIMADLGLGCGDEVPCEGEGRAKRLARFGEPFSWEGSMANVVQ